MSMEHTERELEKFGHSDLAKIITGAHEAFRKRHPDLKDIPFPTVADTVASRVKESQPERVETVKVYPEISLDAEWQRQAKSLARVFAKELDRTEEQYIEGLPKFTPQPESFRGRLDTPIIVEPRIPVKRQCELVGIKYFLGPLNKGDWPNDPQEYKTPNAPYITWVDEGARNMNRKVQDVRKKLSPDERGGTEFDGVALCIDKPDILKIRFLDLPGTVVGSGRARSGSAPYLSLWLDRPVLYYNWVGNASPGFGSLVCGRQT